MKERVTIKDQLIALGCPIQTEHEIWEQLYSVVNFDTEVTRKRQLEWLRDEQEDIGRILNADLEQALRRGALGDRLRGMYIMAIGFAGEEITREESLFVMHNIDRIKGENGGQFES